MASWQELVDAEPEFAARVQQLFDAHRHKVLATLRRDGSPRVSGIEVSFQDGEVWIGSMLDSRKADDLARDPRLAIHSGSDDPPDDPTTWQGDAKLAGRAVLVDDPERLRSMGSGDAEAQSENEEQPENEPGGYLYRIDLREVVWTAVGDPPDHLAVQVWRSETGLRHLRSSS